MKKNPIACPWISRRQFIRYVGIGGATVVVAGFFGCESDESPLMQPRIGRFNVGIPDDYMEDDLLYYPEGPVLVGLDGAGFYAMSAICTHKFCKIGDETGEVEPEGPIICLCHNSVFSRTGEIISGPAESSLQHYKLEQVDGHLVCDTSVEVASDTRLVV
jgi:nitrite reductase/ring-hydroxylating ferredoxin subunit